MLSFKGAKRRIGDAAEDVQFRYQQATIKDLDTVLSIADSNRNLEDVPKFTGALSSLWQSSEYRQLIKAGNVFLVLTSANKVIGLIVGYSGHFGKNLISKYRRYSSVRSEVAAYAMDMVGELLPFVVIEQILVRTSNRNDDIFEKILRDLLTIRFLNQFSQPKMFNKDRVRHVFIARLSPTHYADTDTILSRIGLVETLEYQNDEELIAAGLYGQVWHVTAEPNSFTKVFDGSESSYGISSFIAGIETARELYLHEDNLNWKKLTVLASFLFAQLAALWVVLDRAFSTSVSEFYMEFYIGTVIVIGLVGFRSILTCNNMLKSGRRFMASHKATLKILQAQLSLRTSDYIPGIWCVPTTSITVRTLPDLGTVSLAISGIGSTAALLSILLRSAGII